MRLLELRLQAFESYLDEQTVDFSRFAPDSIYLIDGETGAGKTTLFQAILFALYGQVVDRDHMKPEELRTIGAPDDIHTRVTLVFESQGQVYTVERKPAQTVSKARGTGTTTKPAEAILYRGQGAEKEIICSGFGAVNSYIQNNLIHLNCDQFQKVVLIPQGEFRQVLVDSSSNRQDIYREIFHTQLYDRFATIIKDRANEAKRKVDDDVKLASTTMAGFNVSLDPDNIDAGEIKRLSAVDVPYVERKTFLNKIQSAYSNKYNELRALADYKGKEVNELTGEKNHREEYDRATREVSEANAQIAKCSEGVMAAEKQDQFLKSRQPEIDQCKKDVADIKARIGNYNIRDSIRTNLNSTDQELKDLRSTLIDRQSKSAGIENRITSLQVELSNIPTDLTERLKRIMEEKSQAELLTELCKRMKSARASLDELGEQCEERQGELEKASENFEAQKAEFDRIYRGYVNGTAAQLAADLSDGFPCPVCGSKTHPNPAVTSGPSVSSEDLRQAQEKLTDASDCVSECRTRLDESKKRKDEAQRELIENLSAYGATDYDSLSAAIIKLQRQATSRASASAEAEKTIQAQIDRKAEIEKDIRTLEDEKAKISNEIAAAQANIASLTSRLAELQKQEADILEKLPPYATVDDASRAVDEMEKKIAEQDRCIANNDEKLKEHKENLARAEGEKKSSQKIVDSYSGRVPREIQELNDIITKLSREGEELNDKARGTWSVVEECGRVLGQLKTIEDRAGALTRTAERLGRLAGIFAGTSSQGGGKTGLENFVLARYLDLVLDKANMRLRPMTDGQFSLVRAKEARDNRSQSGLDIDVLDYREGKTRNAATLSGGESFMASLALALGLADEVSEEAGGTRVECMFIDEGFGTLDSGRLSNLLEVLYQQTAKQGKVSVGLISHVDELARLIPDRIEVKKDAEGHSHAQVKRA